jgi:hypothetical protein
MFVAPIVSAFSQPSPRSPAYRPTMNIQPPDNFRGGRPFFFPNGGGFEGHHGGPPALAWVIFALQLLMLAALAVLLVRAFTQRGPRFAGPPAGVRRFKMRPGPPDPLTHVRMRYANGEISRDEYLQVTRDLGGTPESPPDAPTEELPAD